MAKMSKRILALVLTMLMVVSMAAVFTLPALAAEEEVDYEAYFEDAFLINQSWKKEELVDDRVIFFEYRGKVRQVICDTSKHFNNWADAEASAFSKANLGVNNIYSYTPVFIFSAGTYSNVNVPTRAIILGANAGISPNADIKDADWTVEKVAENGGWPKNTDRKAKETIITSISHQTRVPGQGDGQPKTGAEEERFAYWLEQAKQSGKDPQLDFVLDGITLRGRVFVNHYDHYAGSTANLLYPATGAALMNTAQRKIDITYNNVIFDACGIVQAENGAHNIVSVYVNDSEVRGGSTNLVVRDIKNAFFKNVYFHDLGEKFTMWNNSDFLNYNICYANGASKTYAVDFGNEVETNIDRCMFYNLNSANERAFLFGPDIDRYGTVKGASTTFNHVFNNNIFYDAACGQDNYILKAIDLDSTSKIKVKITNNQFHQTEEKRVFAPLDHVTDHNKSDDVIVYENNVVSGGVTTSDFTGYVDFNNLLRFSIKANGVTFNAKDTAVVAPVGITTTTQNDVQTFTDVYAGTKYKFTIDNVNVFATMADFNAAKDKFAGKKLILLAGNYGDIDIKFPVTIYGADFGTNPNDTSKATAANGYDWAENSKFGIYGKTVVGKITIANADEMKGNVTIDGVVQTAELNDTTRKSTDSKALNITVKNVVLDDTATTGTSANWYNLGNDRTKNGSKGTLNDTALGKKYADSFTLENVRVESSTSHSTLLDEYVPANTTIDGLYVDGDVSGKASSILSKFKLGVNNTNGSVTVKNSNIRNGQSADYPVYVESYSDKLTGSVAQVTEQKFAVTVENNVFYNASSNGTVVRVRTGLVTSLDVNANVFVNTANAEGKIINAQVTHKNTENDIAALPLNGNISISCNTLSGYADDQLIGNFKMGGDYPVAVAHTFGDAVPNGDADCKNVGTATKTCTKCGETEVVAGTALGNHKWDAGVYNNDATTEKDGTKTFTCGVCGETEVKTADGTKLPASGGNQPGGNEPGGNEPGGNQPGGNQPGGNQPGGNQQAPVDKVDSTKKFTDVKAGKWYTDAIDHAVTYGLVSGVSETNFGLNVEINRGMFITILARVAGVDTSSAANKAATTKFTDVKAGKYYTAAIAWANTNGIVSGKTDKTFEPETAITRQELAVMIVNFAKFKNIELKATENAVTFADNASIAKWAKTAVATCQTAGIINGYNESGKINFKPTATATRAEATQMLYKFHKGFIVK